MDAKVAEENVTVARNRLVAARSRAAQALTRVRGARAALGESLRRFLSFGAPSTDQLLREHAAKEHERRIAEHVNPPEPGPPPRYSSELDRVKASRPHRRRGETGLVKGARVKV